MRPTSALVSGATALILAWTVPVAASTQQSAPAATSLVFDGVTVVDVEQGKFHPAQRVVIAGNRIQAVGDVGAVKTPQGARVVDARGKYLIPGLWDLHTHSQSLADLFYPLFIANGVTGIRDAWSETPLEKLIQWRQEILAGTRVGPPRQLLTGPPLIGLVVDMMGSEYAERQIDSLKALGANFIKTYDFGFALAAALRRAGLPFGGHIPESISAIEASDSGASILDHVSTARLDKFCWGEGSVEQCQPVAARLRKNGTWFVPTLTRAAFENFLPKTTRSLPIFARLRERADTFWAGSMLHGNWLRDSAVTETALAPSGPMADSRGILSIIQQVGLPILAGTDVSGPEVGGDDGEQVVRTMPPGFSLHAELAMSVAEGLTTLSALQSATLNPAKLLHATDSLGTVAAGKLADLVLLDADPLADIANTTTIRAVVANGRYFDRAALDLLLAEVQAKAKEKGKEPPR